MNAWFPIWASAILKVGPHGEKESDRINEPVKPVAKKSLASRGNLGQVQFDTISCPGSHTAAEEVGVFGPNRAAQCEGGSQYWPIVLIATVDALASDYLIRRIRLSFHSSDNTLHQIKRLHWREERQCYFPQESLAGVHGLPRML
jgi:hypothetical protein